MKAVYFLICVIGMIGFVSVLIFCVLTDEFETTWQFMKISGLAIFSMLLCYAGAYGLTKLEQK